MGKKNEVWSDFRSSEVRLEDDIMGAVEPHFSYLMLKGFLYFFAGAPRTASLAALATRNFRTVFAGILISSPVAGFLPIRAFLFCFTSLPRPGIANSPFFASR